MTLRLKYLVIAGIIILMACKTPYTPKPITTVTNYLVVEGLINISDSTYINLSRTVTVSANSTIKPELKATITIESNAGGSYPLKELGNGIYVGPGYNLSATGQYRLRIRTLNGSTYLSDLVQAKAAPPIDTVMWVAKDDGAHISLNTHDPQNNSRYYRWDYTETWEIYTFFQSGYVYSNGALVPRTPAQQVHHCWGYANGSEVLLNSTATLSQDIIQGQPITFIPITSEKLSYKYSILVKQYTITKDAYDYWTLLKKNTEQLGSIFDAQPSASIGNIHNVNNPAEPVIGFISAGTASSNRIFIDRFTQLPYEYFLQYYNNSPYSQFNYCDTIVPSGAAIFGIRPEIIVPLINGIGMEPPGCADCTVTGATTTQPYFWK